MKAGTRRWLRRHLLGQRVEQVDVYLEGDCGPIAYQTAHVAGWRMLKNDGPVTFHIGQPGTITHATLVTKDGETIVLPIVARAVADGDTFSFGLPDELSD